jgi:ATP-dependent protease ClpP protease subunit
MDDLTRLLSSPNARLWGPIDQQAANNLLDQIHAVRDAGGPLVLELTTNGGDADGGRRIAQEIRLMRQWHGRETWFLGKTAVMSAGVTIMAAFPKEYRYLTRDCRLLVHERRMQKTIELNGPMAANIQIVKEVLAEIETAEAVEREGFAELVEGSNLTEPQLFERAVHNYYLSAQEALDLGLIAGVV